MFSDFLIFRYKWSRWNTSYGFVFVNNAVYESETAFIIITNQSFNIENRFFGSVNVKNGYDFTFFLYEIWIIYYGNKKYGTETSIFNIENPYYVKENTVFYIENPIYVKENTVFNIEKSVYIKEKSVYVYEKRVNKH